MLAYVWSTNRTEPETKLTVGVRGCSMRWILVEVHNFLLFVLLAVLIMATSTTNNNSPSVHPNHVTVDVIADIIMPSVNVDQPHIFYTVNTFFIPAGEGLKIRSGFDVKRIHNFHTS